MSAEKSLPEALLMDYAAGTTSPAIGLIMATHLAICQESRALFALMQSVGGALLDDLEGDPVERISAKSVLAIADQEEPERTADLRPEPVQPSPRAGTPPTFDQSLLPAPLRTAEAVVGGERRWRRLGFGVAATKLAVPSEGERAHLLWAKGGTGIATHRHIGREVVLVLKGAFLDDGIRYGPGDIAVSEDGTVHSPYIDEGEDCLCLAVTEAPVQFTGWASPILNRLCTF